MSCCEKCWGDAYLLALIDGRAQADHYGELLKERMGNPCTKEEQEGSNDLPMSSV